MTKPAQKNGIAMIAAPTITGGKAVIRAVSSGTQATSPLPTHPDSHTQRMLVDLHQRIVVLERASALFAGARLLTGLSFTGGTTKYVAHQLRRPYRSYIAFRQTVAAVLTEQALPTGYTSDTYIALQSASSGTFDVLVF